MNANVQNSSAGDRWGPWVYRSLLYMPVNEERFLAKAHTRGADAIILDLEDSVALQEKAAARNNSRPPRLFWSWPRTPEWPNCAAPRSLC